MRVNGLAGRSLLITGAGSGIGRATAVMLASDECYVTVADINEVGGVETVAQIKAAGGRAHFVHVNVAEEGDIQKMVTSTLKEYGKLDGAVNAAGIPQRSKVFHELTAAEFDRCIAINLRGTFLCMQQEIIAMLKGNGGSIVNISSMAAIFGVARVTEYCASKAGILGLTRAAAADYATGGIRVNSILPGGTLTPMLQTAIDQDPTLETLLAKGHPMNRIARASEIASAVQWLLSDDSSFVTGIELPVSGGQSAVSVFKSRSFRRVRGSLHLRGGYSWRLRSALSLNGVAAIHRQCLTCYPRCGIAGKK